MAPPIVLVVDDEEKNVKLFKAILSHENLEVVVASNGQTALQLIEERLPDLILLDVMMPGMNGFDVCRLLKKEARTQMIPVLMVTALKEKEDRIMALHAGADDFLSKPIDGTELIVRVKSLLRIKRYYDELTAKNRQIHEKNLQLEKMEDLKERLYHMIIHDLRSPLTSMLGAMELLQLDSEGLAPSQNEMVDVCLRGCQELRQMIDSVLDVYRIEDGNMKLHKETFDWSALIEQLEPLFLVQAQAKQIQLDFLDSFEPSGISGDRNLLTRVVSNLLDNSIRHTQKGGTINVLSEQNSKHDSLLVSIKDSGNGIPKEYQQKIFDKFEQLPERQGEKRHGSCGLGLTFCKMAVEAHGGRIWVESEGEGTGATFCFELPIGTVPAQDQGVVDY
jgi:signal transduction histidine kinase